MFDCQIASPPGVCGHTRCRRAKNSGTSTGLSRPSTRSAIDGSSRMRTPGGLFSWFSPLPLLLLLLLHPLLLRRRPSPGTGPRVVGRYHAQRARRAHRPHWPRAATARGGPAAHVLAAERGKGAALGLVRKEEDAVALARVRDGQSHGCARARATILIPLILQRPLFICVVDGGLAHTLTWRAAGGASQEAALQQSSVAGSANAVAALKIRSFGDVLLLETHRARLSRTLTRALSLPAPQSHCRRLTARYRAPSTIARGRSL